MRPSLRLRLVFAGAVLALLGVSAPATAAIHAAQLVVRNRDISVGSGQVGVGTATCPAGDRVVSGGISWHLPGEPRNLNIAAQIRASLATSDQTGWYAAARHRLLSATAVMRITALCLPKSALGPYTKRQAEVEVAPSAFAGSTLSCPTGQRIVNGGAYWHAPGGTRDPSVAGYVTGSAPLNARQWFVSGANRDATNLILHVEALCLPNASVGAYSISWTSVAFSVPTRNQTPRNGTADCGSGQQVVSGGAYWQQPSSRVPDSQIDGDISTSVPNAARTGWVAAGRSLVAADVDMLVMALCRPA